MYVKIYINIITLDSYQIQMGIRLMKWKTGSRVVVVRPTFSETWAFFVRKFDVQKATLEQIDRYEGKENAIALIRFLVKGARIISLTGEQGTRKNNNAYGDDWKYLRNNEPSYTRNSIRASLKKDISNKKYTFF